MAAFASLLVLLPIVAHPLVQAQQCFAYSVATITDCAPATTTVVQPTPTPSDGVVTVTMPECPHCHCDCAHTKTYTTVYEAFCPTGVAQVTYTVNEIYSGMSTAPVLATPTEIPHGFTTTVATCHECGEAPITKTLTYPVGGSCTVTDAPQVPSGKPGAQKPAGDAPSSNSQNPSNEVYVAKAPQVTPIGASIAALLSLVFLL
ncbi:hypothetical protein VHEMI05043 [[Torrubiella] hemipterigena]|uniref:Uncharacterized protein n=1 Tax=[Torrubiella] hemipterigena TaxID=1531966 RepID=A0A0A1TFR7_9HYPO|nr:hypothetical protein VHEMI05043 [[Torrubiella] hemipterigena]